MINDILWLIAITFLPFLELRASIPYGIISTNLHWFTVFLICVLVNIFVGILIYFILDFLIRTFTKIKVIENFMLTGQSTSLEFFQFTLLNSLY